MIQLNSENGMSKSNGVMRLEHSNRKKDFERFKSRLSRHKYFYLMAIPAFAIIFIFKYLPMIGIRFAFYEYGAFGDPKYIGLDNFIDILSNSRFWDAFKNTLLLSVYNIVSSMLCSITVALLLNEITNKRIKSFLQTTMYLPHFLSWVVVAAIFTLLLSPENGLVNAVIKSMGGEPIYFLTSQKWWRTCFVFISRWKETGWGTIIYLAALSSIDPQLYDAASIDGAGRLKQTWHITLPAIQMTILTVFILSLSSILNLFMPVYVLYNPLVYPVSDVIETYNYRVGLIQAEYGYSTAVGLFKSVISMTLVLGSNKLSKKITGHGVF